MLLREILIVGNLSQYSVIMLDVAHERTIHTNFQGVSLTAIYLQFLVELFP